MLRNYMLTSIQPTFAFFISHVQNATVDQLYERVFERLRGEMSRDENVNDFILISAGMSLHV